MPVKEMTYLFIVIGVSVINALTNKKVSYAELMFANFAIILITYTMEKLWFKKNKTPKSEAKQSIIYNNVALLKPENRAELLADLTQKTGSTISKVKVDLIDFDKSTAELTIYWNI